MVKGRVIEVHRTNFLVAVEGKEIVATVRGNFHTDKDFPKVGDYVTLEILNDGKGVIESVEKRKSVIKRRISGGEEEQIMVANVDLIFVVMGLDQDYNVSRLERYILLASQSNIPLIIILNKVDLVENSEIYFNEVVGVAGKIPVISVSATTGENMAEMRKHLNKDTTAVLLGSSGAGKSTITNWLLEEAKQAVSGLREGDGKGRHTTATRQLFTLPSGGYLIDTAGIRELLVQESDSEIELEVFHRIETIATNCRFRNCDHERSEGCAVVLAVEEGNLTERELSNYHKLKKERLLQGKGANQLARHEAQNQKRQSQKLAAIKKQRLGRNLR